jgi:hypothetical protein
MAGYSNDRPSRPGFGPRPGVANRPDDRRPDDRRDDRRDGPDNRPDSRGDDRGYAPRDNRGFGPRDDRGEGRPQRAGFGGRSAPGLGLRNPRDRPAPAPAPVHPNDIAPLAPEIAEQQGRARLTAWVTALRTHNPPLPEIELYPAPLAQRSLCRADYVPVMLGDTPSPYAPRPPRPPRDGAPLPSELEAAAAENPEEGLGERWGWRRILPAVPPARPLEEWPAALRRLDLFADEVAQRLRAEKLAPIASTPAVAGAAGAIGSPDALRSAARLQAQRITAQAGRGLKAQSVVRRTNGGTATEIIGLSLRMGFEGRILVTVITTAKGRPEYNAFAETVKAEYEFVAGVVRVLRAPGLADRKQTLAGADAVTEKMGGFEFTLDHGSTGFVCPSQDETRADWLANAVSQAVGTVVAATPKLADEPAFIWGDRDGLIGLSLARTISPLRAIEPAQPKDIERLAAQHRYPLPVEPGTLVDLVDRLTAVKLSPRAFAVDLRGYENFEAATRALSTGAPVAAVVTPLFSGEATKTPSELAAWLRLAGEQGYAVTRASLFETDPVTRTVSLALVLVRK